MCWPVGQLNIILSCISLNNCLFLSESRDNKPAIVELVGAGGAMMTLISCIFCHCQVPASACMAKYEEHLQVKLAVMIDVDCLITLAAHHHNRSASDWCRNKCDSSGMAQHNS